MSKEIYTGKLFRVMHEEVDLWKKIKTFEYVERAPWVRIFVKKDNAILITREYRRELDIYDYRLPWGKVFDRLEEYKKFLASGKNLEDAVIATTIKEAKEETGIIIHSCHIISKDTLWATVKRDLYYVQADDFDERNMIQELGAGEDISVHWMTTQQVLDLMKFGQMSESRTRAFLYDML
jgi:hypothetical protein